MTGKTEWWMQITCIILTIDKLMKATSYWQPRSRHSCPFLLANAIFSLNTLLLTTIHWYGISACSSRNFTRSFFLSWYPFTLNVFNPLCEVCSYDFCLLLGPSCKRSLTFLFGGDNTAEITRTNAVILHTKQEPAIANLDNSSVITESGYSFAT